MTIKLPVHPLTGWTALGLRRDGRPIWPVMGGDGTTPPPNPPNPPAPPAPPSPNPPTPPGDPANPADPPLGPNGEKALATERAERKKLEAELAKLKPLEKLLDVLGGGEKPKDGQSQIDQLTERFAQQEKALTDERTARFKSEVALDKKLTADQAAMLVGSTKEELAAHADKLLELFGKPAEDPGTKRGGTPRPDPSQGARPGGQASKRDAGLAEARKRFGPKPGAAATT